MNTTMDTDLDKQKYTDMHVAILAGGVGSRLWPRSRNSRPKQFSDITGAGLTMLQATTDRLSGLVPREKIMVVTGTAYVDLVAEQLPWMPAKNIIAEPRGRNTAPAIGLVAVHLRRQNPSAIFAVLPADHVILDRERFQVALRKAEQAAHDGYLVTLGIEPDQPHTGYGYIQRGEPLGHTADMNRAESLPVFDVKRFLEKPDRATAKTFLADGGYYWNGGIFVSRADRMLAEIERQMPAAYACFDQITAGLDQPNSQQITEQAWTEMPSISIDYGVMEGAERVAMVPLQAGWNDVGSWDALTAVLEPDSDGNYVAAGTVESVDSQGNIIYCDKKPLVALIGAEDLVIVDTGDVLLVGHKHKMQQVKDMVERLKAEGRQALL